MLTNRILRFLHDKSQKDKEEYERFYRDYGIFLKEGVLSSTEQLEKVSENNSFNETLTLTDSYY